MYVIVEKQLANLMPDQLVRMREKLERFHKETEGQILLGTGCSGTDGVVHAFDMVFRWWRETFGLHFTLKHKVCCESIAWKVDFIRQHWNPEVVFQT